MIRSEDIRKRVRDIDDYLLKKYKESKPIEKRDWRTYEQQLMKRVKGAIRNLEPLIDEVTNIEIHRVPGRPPELDLKQSVTILLVKELIGKSNRSMASMLDLFCLLSGIDVSYKKVERLYSNYDVSLAILNLHLLIMKKKGVKKINACGDGTGYSLSIKKHYASETQIRKDKAKEYSGTKAFVYSFKMMDLDSKMYVAFGMSLKSEKEAFDKAMEMLKRIDIEIESVRLDKYYSYPSYVDIFGKAKVYVIPKKNATLNGSWKWKDLMAEFVNDTMAYLRQYYLRNNSESGFSADKRWFGWKVAQKRDDRISTTLTCTGVWHNLMNLYPG
jgi:transposase